LNFELAVTKLLWSELKIQKSKIKIKKTGANENGLSATGRPFNTGGASF